LNDPAVDRGFGLPHVSASRPTKGAANATAVVVAVTVKLTAKWLAPNTD